jgi:hypothetical protein
MLGDDQVTAAAFKAFASETIRAIAIANAEKTKVEVS